MFTFGFGRRQCPGKNLAEREIVVAMAKIIWGFNVEKVKEIVLKTMPGLAAGPYPFEVKFVPRDGKVAELLGV